MDLQKQLAGTLCGALLAGCLAGCGAVTSQGGGTVPMETLSPQTTGTAAPSLSVFAADSGEDREAADPFGPYAPFGLTYDAEKDQLQYHGKVVRWFQDYYPIADGSLAGRDHFSENGVVDVYAVRDLSNIVRYQDGSFDPSGKLVGIREFSEQEFAARDIGAIKNPPSPAAITGDPPSPEELEEMAKEYEPFGVTYDVRNNQWYYNGEKVRFLWDVLTSNGESLTGGKFHGAIRTWESAGGTIGISTVRDHTVPNASGHGTLTGIETFDPGAGFPTL